MDRISDHFVRLAEGLGEDVPVTVLVDGTHVTGTVTAFFHYAAWRALETRAPQVQATMTRTNPPTEDQRAEAKRAFWRSHDRPDGEPDQDRLAQMTFDRFALRNAAIDGIAIAYLLVNADRVGAIS